MRQAHIWIVFLLAAGAAHAQGEPLPEPPLLAAPGGDARQPSATAPDDDFVPRDQVEEDFGIRADPYAGTFVGKEVAAGALGVFAADVLSAGVGIGVFAALEPSHSGLDFTAYLVGVASFALLDLALTPLAAALGVYWAAPKDSSHNGLFGALLGAYTAQLGIGLLWLALSGALIGAFGNTGEAPSAMYLVADLGLMILHYGALPMSSSLGLHWGGAVNRGHARRPEVLPTTPTELYARAHRSSAATLFALAF